MKWHFPLSLALGIGVLAGACNKDDDNSGDPATGPSGPRLVLRFHFDSTQVRLNNIGQPSEIPQGHAAQSPRFNSMSAHYVEFAPNALTQLGQGEVVYHAPETDAGGATAIAFDQGVRVGDGGTFLDLPLSELSPGTYTWLRVSLAYQNYDIDFRYTDTQFGLGALDLEATVASFIGYNTYLTSFPVNTQSLTVNDDRLQGFWAFEVLDPPLPIPVVSGQAPAGATTVVNPIQSSSPVPAGSCVVTGAFASPLVITGNETEDVVITVSLSTNKSFEWRDALGDGIYEPLAGDTVVDMGIRGMLPLVE